MIQVKNLSDSNEVVLNEVGKRLGPEEIYLIPEVDRITWASSDQVVTAIITNQVIICLNNVEISGINEQISILRKEVVQVVTVGANPFASKTLPDGKKLFKRCTGIPGVEIANGATENLDFVIPYPHMKIIGACIFNTNFGDTVNFYVLDDATGTYSGVPNYVLNQFGFNVNLPEGSMENTCKYDADLYGGMKVRVEYTNNSGSTKIVYVNFDVHEVSDS
jgi:hypothetical protein